MTSLGEVYHRAGGGEIGLRRLYAGVGLFLLGAVLVVAGIVVATTGVVDGPNTTLFDLREWGGILAGVGTPLVFLGILTVLPASRSVRAAAVIGTAVAFLGVALFSYAYPYRWSGATAPGLPDLTLPTVGLYFLGAITTFWCLFVGVANFKTRNDPGGTVRMEITKQGETRIVEVNRSDLRKQGLGGIGFFGETPDGEVETQTAQTSPASDGGADANDVRSPLDEGPDAAAAPAAGDVYCGNCAHFEYVRTDDGIQPYCGFHEELMDDMEPCQQWTGR